MSDYPERYMRDGTATTRRAHDVVSVECDSPYHVVCYEAVTSWAGDTAPRRNPDWHIYMDRQNVWHVFGPLSEHESVQFVAGLKRRAHMAFRKSLKGN